MEVVESPFLEVFKRSVDLALEPWFSCDHGGDTGLAVGFGYLKSLLQL